MSRSATFQSQKIKMFRSASPLPRHPLVMLPRRFTRTLTVLRRRWDNCSLPQRGHMTDSELLNWTPSCSRRVKLWPSRGKRHTATRSLWRHQPPSPRGQLTWAWVSRVCLHLRPPMFLHSCQIGSCPRPRPVRPPLLESRDIKAAQSLWRHQAIAPSQAPPSLHRTGGQLTQAWAVIGQGFDARTDSA